MFPFPIFGGWTSDLPEYLVRMRMNEFAFRYKNIITPYQIHYFLAILQRIQVGAKIGKTVYSCINNNSTIFLINNSKTYFCFTLYIHIGERMVLFEGFLLELPGQVGEFLVYKYTVLHSQLMLICNIRKGVLGEILLKLIF